MIGAAGSILATSSVTLAFDHLHHDLGAPLEAVQWVASGYLLGLATVISSTGWLARRFGARRLYLTALALFAVVSLLCALAWSIEALIAFRVLQGIAGGAIMPVGQMMLASRAGTHRMGRVMSVAGVPMILAPTLGPVVGGLLVAELGWRWIFLMSIPLAVAALALGARVLPPMPAPKPGAFDLTGFVLLTVGAPTLVYGLARVVSIGTLTAEAAILIGSGIGLIAAFARHAWVTPRPLLEVRLWSNRGFAACAVTSVCVSASVFGTIVIIPLYFQLGRGLDPLAAGLLMGPQGLGTLASLAVTGRLTDRVGGGRVALGGITITTLASLPLLSVDAGTPYWLLVVILFVRGVGAGGSIMPAMAAVFAMLERHELSDSTPQMNLVQRLGQAVGAAILTLVLASHLESARGAEQTAAAFGDTFGWAIAMMTLGLIPAATLAIVDRGHRRAPTFEPALQVAAPADGSQ